MSNTVILTAATGERRHAKSLSTADPICARLRARCCDRYGWDVPVLWHDIDYPYAQLVAGAAGFGDRGVWGHEGPMWWSLADDETLARMVEWGCTLGTTWGPPLVLTKGPPIRRIPHAWWTGPARATLERYARTATVDA